MQKTNPTVAQPSQRMLRVAELIRHSLSQILSQGVVDDPALSGLVISVPHVSMSPDLKWANIAIMPLGGKGIEQAIEALNRNRKFLRGELAHRINLKYAPDLRFKADEGFDARARIDALLHSPKVLRDLETKPDEENS